MDCALDGRGSLHSHYYSSDSATRPRRQSIAVTGRAVDAVSGRAVSGAQ